MNTYPEQDCFRRDVPKDAAEILANDILKEQATRINEDALIRVSIADEATARAQRDAQLELWFNTEEADRISGDNALASQIAAETDAREDADTLLSSAITAEENARVAADTSLGDAIVDEEDARIAADSTLNTLITNEASTRASADTALGTQISDEVSARTAADTDLGNQISTEASTRALADVALDTRLDVLEPLVMTEAEHTKLAGIAAGAEVNVNADWNSVSGDSQILNKPDIPDSMFDFSDHSRFIFGDNAYGSTLVTNLNTIEKTGTYTAFAGATGAPDATHAFGVQHSNSTQNANIAFQQAVAVDANMPTYARIKLSGTWSAWIRTWNAKDVPGFSATPSAGNAMVWPGAYYPWTPVDNTSRVAEYTGDGGGATIKDRAGNGNNLTATNITYVNGKFGKEMSFNGSTSYAQASSPVIGTTGTIAIRLKPASLAETMRPFGNRRYGAGGGMNVVIFATTGLFRFVLVKADTRTQTFDAGNVSTSMFLSFILTWDGTTVKTYREGVLIGTTSQEEAYTTPLDPLALGRMGIHTLEYFNGIISHFRYDSRIWTADEARAWSLNPISIDSRVV